MRITIPGPAHHAPVRLGIVLVAIMLVAVPMVAAQSHDWTNHGRNAQQQGRATGDTLETPLKSAWSKTVDGGITGSPVITDDIVVVATHKGKVSAYDTATSERLWVYNAGDQIRGSPAIDTDHVYVATYNDTTSPATGKLHQISLEAGTSPLSAPVDLKSGSWAGPTIDAGRLFIGLENGKLQHYATIDVRTLVWEFDTKLTDHATDFPAKPIRVTPLVEDNVVYFSAHNKLFYAVNANSGKELWVENLIDNSIYSSGAVDGAWKSGNADGAVYVGSYDGTIYAYETEKEPTLGNCKFGTYNATHPKNHACSDIRLWKWPAGSPIHSSISIGNGKLYFGDNSGKIHAITQAATQNTVKQVWSYNTGDSVQAAPAIMGKSIVVGSFDKKLYVFTENDDGTLNGSPWSTTLSGRIQASPAIANAMVFVATQDGVLHAFISGDATAPDVVNTPDEATNLRIDNVKLTPRVMTEGQALAMDVSIKNDGSVDANGFKLDYLLEGAVLESTTLSLKAGANTTHQFKMISAPAEANLRFVVDSANAIQESNENDNVHTMHLLSGQAADGGSNGGGGLVIDQPADSLNGTTDPDEDVPAPGFVLVGLAAVALAVLARRRR